MSSKRPGTVDYSHFDNISVSSSEDDDDEEEREEDDRRQRQRWARYQADRRRDRDGGDEEMTDNNNRRGANRQQQQQQRQEPRPQRMILKGGPAASMNLAALQKAWSGFNNNNNNGGNNGNNNNNNNNNTANVLIKQCAACQAAGPRFKCSRCGVIHFCNATCQRNYHPIHSLECIDARQHQAYWGFLLDDHADNNNKDKQQQKAMPGRILARRKRLLKRAAALAAIERARLARVGRGMDGPNAKGGGKGGGKMAPKEETCIICQCEFTIHEDLEAAGSLACPGGHVMCAECTGVYVKSVLGDLETSHPAKCSLCKAEYDPAAFERQLTAQQQHQVQVWAAMNQLQPGQELMECKECHALEIVSPTRQNPLVLWWCQVCRRGTCVVCNKDLPAATEPGAAGNAQEMHELCARFKHAKEEIELALERGSKMSCPGCGLAGRKDDACTHMTCGKCTTVWCYVCGLHVRDCDKAPPRRTRRNDQDETQAENDIFLHNQDWEVNEKRCPMYLTQILEVDLGWMGDDWQNNAEDEDFEDDERCLDYFHRFQTLRLLQQVRATLGPKEFDAAFEAFDSIRNSGYTLEEIISTDTETLIDRDEYRQYRMEEQGDQEGEDDEASLEERNGENVDNNESEEQQENNNDDHDDNDEEMDDDDDEEDEWDEVPDHMTRIVQREEAHVNEALARSEVSALEDEQLRDALEASLRSSANSSA